MWLNLSAGDADKLRYAVGRDLFAEPLANTGLDDRLSPESCNPRRQIGLRDAVLFHPIIEIHADNSSTASVNEQ